MLTYIRGKPRKAQAIKSQAAIEWALSRAEQFDAFCETIIGAIDHADAKNPLVEVVLDKVVELGRLRKAIAYVHAEHADDLCWMPADVNKIFAAAGLPPQDLHVGDKAAMRKNCDRYVDVLHDGGKWRSYAELETALHAVKAHPDYTYVTCPLVGPTGDDSLEPDGYEPNPEANVAPGDICWRRRRS